MGVFKECRVIAKAESAQVQIANDACDIGIPYYGKGDPRNGIVNEMIAIAKLYAEPHEIKNIPDAPYYMPAQQIKLDLGIGGFLEAGFALAEIDYMRVNDGKQLDRSAIKRWGKDVKGYFMITTSTSKHIADRASQIDY